MDQVVTIKEQIARLDRLKDQLGELRDMLNSLYENDSTYQAHDTAVKEATKVRSGTKKQIQKQPQVTDLTSKIQDLKSQITAVNQNLSGMLEEFHRSTGAKQIEDNEGVLREIVYVAKLVKPIKPSKSFPAR